MCWNFNNMIQSKTIRREIQRIKDVSFFLTSNTAKPMVSKSRPSFLSFRLFFCIRAITTLHVSSSSSASTSSSLNCGLVQKVSADHKCGQFRMVLHQKATNEIWTKEKTFGKKTHWTLQFQSMPRNVLNWSHRCSSCSLQRWNHESSLPQTRWPPSGVLCHQSGSQESCCRSPPCRSSSWSPQTPS